MKLSFETLARIYAAGRNYANMIVGFAASLGLISVAQQKTLTESLGEVWSGISQIAHGLTSIWQVLVVVGGPFVGAVLAWYAQRSAKGEAQAAAIGANPDTKVEPQPDGSAKVTLPPPLAKAAIAADKKAA
jgi:hypothetical protein